MIKKLFGGGKEEIISENSEETVDEVPVEEAPAEDSSEEVTEEVK